MLRGDHVQAQLISSVRAGSARSVSCVKSRRECWTTRRAAAWRAAARLDQGVETLAADPHARAIGASRHGTNNAEHLHGWLHIYIIYSVDARGSAGGLLPCPASQRPREVCHARTPGHLGMLRRCDGLLFGIHQSSMWLGFPRAQSVTVGCFESECTVQTRVLWGGMGAFGASTRRAFTLPSSSAF
jgi:hypothetical protein